MGYSSFCGNCKSSIHNQVTHLKRGGRVVHNRKEESSSSLYCECFVPGVASCLCTYRRLLKDAMWSSYFLWWIHVSVMSTVTSISTAVCNASGHHCWRGPWRRCQDTGSHVKARTLKSWLASPRKKFGSSGTMEITSLSANKWLWALRTCATSPQHPQYYSSSPIMFRDALITVSLWLSIYLAGIYFSFKLPTLHAYPRHPWATIVCFLISGSLYRATGLVCKIFRSKQTNLEVFLKSHLITNSVASWQYLCLVKRVWALLLILEKSCTWVPPLSFYPSLLLRCSVVTWLRQPTAPGNQS